MKVNSPDYADCNTEEAIKDFKSRISMYEGAYMSLDNERDKYV